MTTTTKEFSPRTRASVVPTGKSWGAITHYVKSLTERDYRNDVIIDCQGIQIIDSEDLGALVSLRLKLEANDCHVQLINVGSRVMEVLEVSRINRVIRVSPADAGTSLASRGFGGWLRHIMG